MVKCPCCSRKANILGLVCKCGSQFCMDHRLPEHHNCSYDYKTAAREKLKEELSSNRAPKIIESH